MAGARRVYGVHEFRDSAQAFKDACDCFRHPFALFFLNTKAQRGFFDFLVFAFCVTIESWIIESVKAVSDLYAPVSGEVIEVNPNISNDLDLLSNDAFGKGWLIKLRLSNPAEASSLLDAATYEQQCSAGH